ncbi:MAG: xanthine dehydrogenase family protein molybdopterin-binding subunit [Immundisolibacterales bacterium]|nr:xanthine dehydrogenase family protein molybdopterin-binding subunit [Immundisolibacterales bacterium]
MSPRRLVGRSVRRLEDPRRLRGEGTYVDDVHVPGMLHATVVRSPRAHARIRSIDATEAKAAPGIVAILGARELGGDLRPIPVRLVPDERLLRYLQRPLATNRVRYVGEPVALVVARSRAAAEDAAERVEVDYEPLPPVTDASSAPPAPLFDHTPDNLASLIEEAFGNIDAAFARAERVVRLAFRTGRHSAVPMETRGLVAVPDRGAAEGRGRLTVWGPTKVTHFNRSVLAAMLGWPEHRIRLVEPDVGGGFGARGEFYPEDFLVPCAALRLGRPVKWIEDRVEHLSAINHSREQRYELALALDSDGRFLGLRAEIVNDMGAYLRTHGTVVPGLSAGMLPGPYEMQAYRCRVRCVLTNKTPTGTYRAPGRFECNAARERLIDRAARLTGIGRMDLRMRNLVRPERMPFARGTSILGEEVVYDSGDYPAALAEAVALSGFRMSVPDAVPGAGARAGAGSASGDAPEARPESRAGSAANAVPVAPARESGARAESGTRSDGGSYGREEPGRYRYGMGLACFVEKTGTGPFEGARAFLDRSGALVVATGAADLGQGLETCLAQIAGDALGVDHAGITVRHGDTDLIPHGVGSFASRGTVMAGNAVHEAVSELRTRVLERAAARLGVPPGDLAIGPGGLVRGTGGRSCTLAELAAEPGLEMVRYFRCEQMAYSHGVTVARVKVDTATGLVVPERIWLLYDVGRVVNPSIVAGQIEGGVAQGIGGSLLEELRYDDTGQFLSGSFMDYVLPGTTDVPTILHRDLGRSPSPRNPLGVKGAGEVGIAGVGGAVANAVADALADAEREDDELPLTPERVWKRVRCNPSPQTPAAAAAGGRNPV